MQFGPKASVNRVNVYILQLKQEIEERASEREREGNSVGIDNVHDDSLVVSIACTQCRREIERIRITKARDKGDGAEGERCDRCHLIRRYKRWWQHINSSISDISKKSIDCIERGLCCCC